MFVIRYVLIMDVSHQVCPHYRGLSLGMSSLWRFVIRYVLIMEICHQVCPHYRGLSSGMFSYEGLSSGMPSLWRFVISYVLIMEVCHQVCPHYGFKNSRIQINLFETTNTLSYAINKQV